jgi:hypothetical protein
LIGVGRFSFVGNNVGRKGGLALEVLRGKGSRLQAVFKSHTQDRKRVLKWFISVKREDNVQQSSGIAIGRWAYQAKKIK